MAAAASHAQLRSVAAEGESGNLLAFFAHTAPAPSAQAAGDPVSCPATAARSGNSIPKRTWTILMRDKTFQHGRAGPQIVSIAEP
jgi:hypothetical protein